jgi:hypothetical protein
LRAKRSNPEAGGCDSGLLRFARNDGEKPWLRRFWFKLRIEFEAGLNKDQK